MQDSSDIAALEHEITLYVARQVKIFRQEARLTQKQLAQYLACSYQQLQKYEKGQNRLTVDRLYLLARFFGVSMESFFPGYALRVHPLLKQYLELPDRQRHLVVSFINSLTHSPSGAR